MIVSIEVLCSCKATAICLLCSDKIATATLHILSTQRCTARSIARITKLLLIMDTIIIKNGIEFLRWTDAEKNIWYAELDAVKFFGKEFFEEQPLDTFIGAWQVVYAGEEQTDWDNIPDFIFEYAMSNL